MFDFPILSPSSHQSMGRRSFLAGTVGMAVVGLATACSMPNKTREASEIKVSETETVPPEGREIRAVALNTGQLENLLTVGILPVGMATAKEGSTSGDGIPQFIRDRFQNEFDLDSIAVVGTRQAPDLEAIAALDPTIIFANKKAEKELLTQLENIAPLVLGKGGGENWKEDLLTVAEAVDKKKEAQEQLDNYEREAQAWAEERAHNPAIAQASVSLIRNKADQYSTMGPISLPGIVVADTGLIQPPSQSFVDKASKDISKENIGDIAADYIFYGLHGSGEELLQDPLWQDLEAVKHNHAIAVDVDKWFLNASLTAAEGVLADLKTHIV